MKKFSDFSIEEKYEALKRVVGFIHANDIYVNQEEFAFTEDEKHVNLIGIRGLLNGERVENKHNEYNDTIFLVRKIGTIREVHEFRSSDDYGTFNYPDKGPAHLIAGQHAYKIDNHKKSNSTHAVLSEERVPSSTN